MVGLGFRDTGKDFGESLAGGGRFRVGGGSDFAIAIAVPALAAVQETFSAAAFVDFQEPA